MQIKNKNPHYISFLPIGGVGEIGSNMFYVESKNNAFIIDCGLLFPDDSFYDLDYLIPNFYDTINPSKCKDIIITHGHEDHIGAIQFLLKEYPHLKVWATPFARELILSKLDYYSMKQEITHFDKNSVINIGELEIHPIHVNHSIPETNGLLIKNINIDASFFYCSDFKVETTDFYEKAFDFDKLKNLQNNSKNFAFIDSTNILNKGKTPSEQLVLKNLDTLLSGIEGRIFLTCFSSNIHRLQSIFDIAKKLNRSVIVSGRSLIKYIDIAKKTKILNHECSYIEETDDRRFDHPNPIIIISGCQGDFFSSLRRLAFKQHSKFKLLETDTVVFSSKTIPGNEIPIIKIQNQISEIGASIILPKDSVIHASGHPGQEDLNILIDKTNITDYIPIHGETLFLRRSMEFINELHPEITPHYLTNFCKFIFSKNKVSNEQLTIQDPIIIHGDSKVIERSNLSKRRKLACNGLVLVHLQKQEITFDYLGLPDFIEENRTSITQKIKNENRNIAKSHHKNPQEELRIAVRRVFNEVLGYKPVTKIICSQ
jgi:ribonuclease J